MSIINYTQEELEGQYKKLPQPLKDALFDPEIAYAIFDAGKKYGMTIDQIGDIADEVGYIIAGLSRPSEFIGNLREKLGVSHDTARDIALEINHAVFTSLRAILKSAHQVEINEDELTKTPATLIERPIPPVSSIPPPPIKPQAPQPQPAPKPMALEPGPKPVFEPAPPHIAPKPQPLQRQPSTTAQTKPAPQSKITAPSAPKPFAPYPPIQKPPLTIKISPARPEEILPKKIIELKDLEEDETEAESEEEKELATRLSQEDEEELDFTSPPAPAVPLTAHPSPPLASKTAPIPEKTMLNTAIPPAPKKEPLPPMSEERKVPSWIREQEAKRNAPAEGKTPQESSAMPPARFTLDLRNKNQSAPAVPQKSMPTKQEFTPEPPQKQKTVPIQKPVSPELPIPTSQKQPYRDPYKEPLE